MASRRHKSGSISPHLVLRLRKGWTFEEGAQRFSKEGRDPVCPDLPKNTRIAFRVPAMARKRDRTEAEDELARDIQVVPPKGIPPSRLLERIQSWPCVEKVWIAPKVSPAGR